MKIPEVLSFVWLKILLLFVAFAWLLVNDVFLLTFGLGALTWIRMFCCANHLKSLKARSANVVNKYIKTNQ